MWLGGTERPGIVQAEWRRPIEFELLAESLEDEDLQLRMTVSGDSGNRARKSQE